VKDVKRRRLATPFARVSVIVVGTRNALSPVVPDRPDVRKGTRRFAIDSIDFYRKLARTPDAQVPGVQYLRATFYLLTLYLHDFRFVTAMTDSEAGSARAISQNRENIGVFDWPATCEMA
jgi:hypothetical protein